MMSEINKRIAAAIRESKRVRAEWWDRLLRRRALQYNGAVTEEEFESVLRLAEWIEYPDSGLAKSVAVFRTFTLPPGRVHRISLAGLASDIVTLVRDDEREPAYLVPSIEAAPGRSGLESRFTTIALGNRGGDEGEQVLNFHPGPPLPLVTLKTSDKGDFKLVVGMRITADEALELGFSTAVVV